jgi:hypothetical protein
MILTAYWQRGFQWVLRTLGTSISIKSFSKRQHKWYLIIPVAEFSFIAAYQRHLKSLLTHRLLGSIARIFHSIDLGWGPKIFISDVPRWYDFTCLFQGPYLETPCLVETGNETPHSWLPAAPTHSAEQPGFPPFQRYLLCRPQGVCVLFRSFFFSCINKSLDQIPRPPESELTPWQERRGHRHWPRVILPFTSLSLTWSHLLVKCL